MTAGGQPTSASPVRECRLGDHRWPLLRSNEASCHYGGVIGLQRISAGLSGPQIHSSSTGMNPMPV